MNQTVNIAKHYKFNNYFDIVYFNDIFHIKSKTYEFSISIALKSISLNVFLKSHNYVGKVVFDLLASNGMEWNRFGEFIFDGKSFLEKYNIIEIEHVDSENAYYKNKEYVDLAGTVLTKEEILQITQEK